VNADQLVSSGLDCAYLIVSASETVPRKVFEAHARTLQAVATLSVGFDHIDLQAARDHHGAVFHSPGVLTDACAEIGMLLLLGAVRRSEAIWNWERGLEVRHKDDYVEIKYLCMGGI
jgi:lactate dehydrogenase-like 2-hydroxyacid dehydrogenase